MEQVWHTARGVGPPPQSPLNPRRHVWPWGNFHLGEFPRGLFLPNQGERMEDAFIASRREGSS